MSDVDVRDISNLEYDDLTIREKIAAQVAFIKSEGQSTDVQDEDYDDADALIAVMEGRENDQ